MKIVSLTNAEVAMGLRLGGIKECHVVENPEDAATTLQTLSSDQNIGIIIVDDEIARINHKLIDEIRSRKKAFPIIVEIQTRERKELAEGIDPLKNLIKRAIGVDISTEKGKSAPKIK